MKKVGTFTFDVLSTLFVKFNLWFMHQAHKRGTAQMTNAYYWKTLVGQDIHPDIFKLLASYDFFDGKIGSHSIIYDFPIDTFSPKEVEIRQYIS